MSLKFLLVFLVFFATSHAQNNSISCTYVNQGTNYACGLSLFNVDGLNNFTVIGGAHLENRTDADVTVINRLSGTSPIVPSIICAQFPNLQQINFVNFNFTIITDTSFGGCRNTNWIRVWNNRIASISANAFANQPNLYYLDIDGNQLTTLPENVFANNVNLLTIDMQNNPYESLPAGLFRPLVNLQTLILRNARLTTLNPSWFETTARLRTLQLSNNLLSQLSDDSFANLHSLISLDLSGNGIGQFNQNVLRNLVNLTYLYFDNNNITVLQPNSFANMSQLYYLSLGANPLEVVGEGIFRGLTSLYYLMLTNCRLRQINRNAFDGLGDIGYLSLNFNQLEDLEEGVFAAINPSYLGLWANRLKSVGRGLFGSLWNLQTIDLDSNVVNAIDPLVIDDAVNLNTLYFSNNLCANGWFNNFVVNRAQHILRLATCFRNFRYNVDTVTEGSADYRFYEGPEPGIVLRVATETEVHIALTPFNFPWNPMVEIHLGTSNNTRSIIRRNQEEIVVVVPSPNVISREGWSGFRITWANHVLLVFRDFEQHPFMAFTMRDFFPVNFYGIRAIGTRASWIVQPFDL